MTRAEISEIFPDATKEAVDKILSINGADVNAVKDKLAKAQEQLQAAMQWQGAADELAKAQKQIEQLTGELTGMKQAETIRLTREKVAGEKQIPAHLLTGETEEACAAQADAILAFAKPTQGWRDGGEVQVKPTAGTRDQFADYLNKIIS